MNAEFHPSEDESLDTVERRRAERHDVVAELKLRVQSDTIEGVADNFSHIGVLFFSEEPLRVQVEVVQDGEPRVFPGRLVRVQRMSERNTGFAVEFDRE